MMIIFASFFAECPSVFPNLQVPKKLRLGKNEAVMCTSPDARPALNIELLVDDTDVSDNANMTFSSDIMNYLKSVARLSSFDKTWNGKQIECCFKSHFCEKLCCPRQTLNIECKLL